jgi:hypothetical protein
LQFDAFTSYEVAANQRSTTNPQLLIATIHTIFPAIHAFQHKNRWPLMLTLHPVLNSAAFNRKNIKQYNNQNNRNNEKDPVFRPCNPHSFYGYKLHQRRRGI